jgi:hypothetical protein
MRISYCPLSGKQSAVLAILKQMNCSFNSPQIPLQTNVTRKRKNETTIKYDFQLVCCLNLSFGMITFNCSVILNCYSLLIIFYQLYQSLLMISQTHGTQCCRVFKKSTFHKNKLKTVFCSISGCCKILQVTSLIKNLQK